MSQLSAHDRAILNSIIEPLVPECEEEEEPEQPLVGHEGKLWLGMNVSCGWAWMWVVVGNEGKLWLGMKVSCDWTWRQSVVEDEGELRFS